MPQVVNAGRARAGSAPCVGVKRRREGRIVGVGGLQSARLPASWSEHQPHSPRRYRRLHLRADAGPDPPSGRPASSRRLAWARRDSRAIRLLAKSRPRAEPDSPHHRCLGFCLRRPGPACGGSGHPDAALRSTLRRGRRDGRGPSQLAFGASPAPEHSRPQPPLGANASFSRARRRQGKPCGPPHARGGLPVSERTTRIVFGMTLAEKRLAPTSKLMSATSNGA